MDFDINQLIEDARQEREFNATSVDTIEPAPSSIQINPETNLRTGYMETLKDLLIGTPVNKKDLLVKLPGTCMFYPYNENKTVMIGDSTQEMHFKIGQHGEIHALKIPAGN